MTPPRLSKSALHSIPVDLRNALTASAKAAAAWNDITPLARNEFICWIQDAKKPETRAHRIARTANELAQGKRRPCCWPGCPHR